MKVRQSTTRKAAILIASLDPQIADALLSQMSLQQAAALREATETLGVIDPDEQEAVIDEFFRIGPMLPEDRPAGIELDSPAAARMGRSALPQEHCSERPLHQAKQSQPRFRSLRDAAGSSLALRLQSEHPQTIAVVVSHLPPQNGADLLASLSPSLQADVARRLVDLEETDPEILLEIERGLDSWLDEHLRSSRRRTAGMVALQSILSAADPLSHETLLTNLSRHDRRLAKQLSWPEGRSYSFDELSELDDVSLGKVFTRVEQDVLTFALAGAGKAMISRALRILPVARAARLRHDLDRSSLMRRQEVDQARQILADTASDLNRTGQLNNSTGRKLSLAG
jgi:flagellar motor switch protein FliG